MILKVDMFSSPLWQSLTPTERLLVSSLFPFTNGTAKCWPTVYTLIKATGLSERTVRANIGSLKTKGAILVEKRPNEASVYDLTPVLEVQLLQGGGATVAPGGATVAPGSPPGLHQGDHIIRTVHRTTNHTGAGSKPSAKTKTPDPSPSLQHTVASFNPSNPNTSDIPQGLIDVLKLLPQARWGDGSVVLVKPRELLGQYQKALAEVGYEALKRSAMNYGMMARGGMLASNHEGPKLWFEKSMYRLNGEPVREERFRKPNGVLVEKIGDITTTREVDDDATQTA